MSTRSERLERHKRGEDARARLKSGDYVQAQEIGPYQSTRAKALASYKPPDTTSGYTPEPIDIVKPGQSFNPLQGTMDRVKSIAASAKPAKKAQEQKAAADYIAQGKATRDAQDPKNPILRAIKNNTVDLLGEGIDRALVNTGLGRVANRFSQSAGNAVGVDTQAAGAAPLLSTGSKFVDKTADIAGALGGMAVNPAALEQGLIQGGYGVANRLTSRLSEGLGKRAATGAIAGAIQNSALSGVQGKTTAKDIGIAAAEGAVLGGVGDPLLHGLGSAVGKLFKRNGVPEAEAQVQEVLALPMGRADAARMRSVNAPGTEPIVNPYTFALPEPQVGAATTGRVAQQVNPYRQQFETLMQTAQKLQAEGKLTPGREDKDLASLWSQMAGRDAPSLDELITLAYKPKPNRLTPDLAQRARTNQTAREAAGAPLPVRSINDRYQQGVFADAAPLTQKVGRAPIQPEVLPPNIQQRPRVDITPVEQAPQSTRAQAMAAKSQTAASATAPPTAATFKTSKGSTYTVDANGSTTRTKTKHEGHDPNDVGLKDPSERTVYVDKNLASNIGMHGNLNSASKPRIVIRDDGMYLVSLNSKTGKWGRHGEKITYTTTPEIGKSPIEFWGIRNEDGLGVVPSKFHAGNEITEMGNSRTTTPPGMRQRGFAQTLQASEKPPQGFKDRLQSAYKPITNEGTLAAANKRLNKDVEEATSFVLGNSRFTAEKATTAQRLIDHYNSTGNYQRAVDVAQKVSEEATRAGQSIQALSMFNRLTPEGVLIHAQRIATKVNEKTSIFAKEAKVTPEIAADIKGLASRTQEMTGIKDLSNNVNDILDRAKAGEKLSDSDAATLKRFVNESKQFVEETTKKAKPPKAPTQPKDKRVRDNVTSFLDAQEQDAKQRLRSRGIQVSSTPLDTWADYAIIGASKMAKGAIKFTDWSEQMVKDLGESVRPNLNQLYDRARQAYEESTKKVSAQTISTAEKLTEKVIKTKQLAPAEADSLRTLAQKVSGLSGDAKITASQDLQVILQGLERPGVLKKISTAQTLGQLLNPKTQVRNAFGNELFYRLERVNKLLSTPIDIARSKLTGGDRTVTFRTNNQGEYWKNWLRGAQAGWKGVNVNGLETQYDLAGQTFRGKYNPLTYLEKTLGVALKSFDTAAYMRAYNDTLGEQATLRLVNEGKKATKENVQKYIREADDNMKTIADEYGKYVTFQDNNIISKGLVALKKGLNVGKDFGAGDLILKYPKTPGALLMRALEYSPAGFMRSASILARPLLKKEANTAEVTQALTRAIIGTAGLSGMGYFLLDKGVLTGAASKDKDIKGLQQSAGQGQYQVNLSALMRLAKSGFDSASAKLRQGDELYTYDWMQPVSIAISIGANTAKNLNEGKQSLKGLAGTVYNSLEGGLGTLTEQSVLSGLKQAAQGYPGQTVTDKILDIVSDIPASFVPTAANQVKQLQDNARRETYSPNKLEQSLNFAQSKVPGLAQKLPQQFDTLGKPKETYQDNSLFNVLLNPGFSSKYELSPEAKYIVDLINESGDETLAPRVPGKTITVDGQSIKLNGDQFSRIQQLQGEETRKRIAQRAERDSNKKLDTRSKNVTKSLTDAGKAARKQLTKELGK